jgi:hypothetical protein
MPAHLSWKETTGVELASVGLTETVGRGSAFAGLTGSGGAFLLWQPVIRINTVSKVVKTKSRGALKQEVFSFSFFVKAIIYLPTS